MTDNAKWKVYTEYLAQQCFEEEHQPLPESLEQLLRGELGVPLERVERVVERLTADGD